LNSLHKNYKFVCNFILHIRHKCGNHSGILQAVLEQLKREVTLLILRNIPIEYIAGEGVPLVPLTKNEEFFFLNVEV
jgi:hypothetical protein